MLTKNPHSSNFVSSLFFYKEQKLEEEEEEEEEEEKSVKTVKMANVDCHDIESILFSSSRDFLVRNNGDQVKVDSLKGKLIGLYFSASWCGPCRRFTPNLIKAYNELFPKGDFEIIFVSGDRDDESFNEYFSKMPWLAIPFSDSETRKSLNGLFKVKGIPNLVILDANGKVTRDDGVKIIQVYGVEGYPFTSEKIKELEEEEEKAKREQSLKSILVSRSRDFVISKDDKKVLVSELEGKLVGLYFFVSTYKPCSAFTPKLVEVYEKLKADGKNFEIVMIPIAEDEESFKQQLEKLPWFSLPNGDNSCQKLLRYFELSDMPTLVIIGEDGKTLHSNIADLIEENGSLAYPFTPERIAELQEIQKAKEREQTLESVLVSGELDFVVGKDGAKFPVCDLVGKTILLYFSAHWCPPCRAFVPKLIEAYNKIKASTDSFEVIFLSSDRDQTSFDEFFATMPWLALPFGDARKDSLSKKFKVRGIPTVVAIGPTGQTVSTAVRELVMDHGADAYPFTDDRLKELKAQQEEMAKDWPKTLKHALHEVHELVLSRRRTYKCNACDVQGHVWSYFCKDCDFDLHPECAFKEEKTETESKSKDGESGGEKTKEGWVCDGEVCSKA